MSTLDAQIRERKRQHVAELYTKFLEARDIGEYVPVVNPEVLFAAAELEAIPDIRRRLFYSQFSNTPIYLDPTLFDLNLWRSQVLFDIMMSQLFIYAPLSEEYREVGRFHEERRSRMGQQGAIARPPSHVSGIPSHQGQQIHSHAGHGGGHR
jgi:hypothetical protein